MSLNTSDDIAARAAPAPRETPELKGRRYLVEGRLVISAIRAGHVLATARGDSGGRYRLGYERGRWWCSCPVRQPTCSHLVALRLVTAPG